MLGQRLLRRTFAVFLFVSFTAPTARTALAQQPPAGPAPAPGSAPTAAPASTNSANGAEEDKKKGDEAMVALRYADALAAYSRSYEASPNPALLYNMGRAYEGLGDFPHALESLEKFSDRASPELKARVPKLAELLADVRRHVSTLVVSSNVDDAEVRVGERVVGKSQKGQVVIRVNAGPARVTVSRDDYFPASRDMTLAASMVETIDAQLVSRSEGGVLTVKSSVAGALAAVDGRSIGVVPAETTLKPGSHKLALRRDGYNPADTNVVIEAGERKEVNVPMSPRDLVTGKWWFWTAIGVAVVAGGVATYVAATTERSADQGTIPPHQVRASLVHTALSF